MKTSSLLIATLLTSLTVGCLGGSGGEEVDVGTIFENEAEGPERCGYYNWEDGDCDPYKELRAERCELMGLRWADEIMAQDCYETAADFAGADPILLEEYIRDVQQLQIDICLNDTLSGGIPTNECVSRIEQWNCNELIGIALTEDAAIEVNNFRYCGGDPDLEYGGADPRRLSRLND